jgi:hypothetical protein
VLRFACLVVVGLLPMGQGLIPASIENSHRQLVTQLSAEQTRVLSSLHPEFRVLSLCGGRFSNGDRDELVLGILTTQGARSDVRRVGLLWRSAGWEVRDIDAELDRDKRVTRSYPLSWAFTLNEKGFVGGMKCGTQAALQKDPSLSHLRGEHTIFDLKQAGLARHAIACFASSDVYDNWDCAVFSRKDDRFRLWFQKARAD